MENIHCGVMLRLYTDDKVFGPGIAELLERVKTTHSLRAAALDMDMSYSKAWKVVRRAESTFGFELLTCTTGGRQGGGATLTPKAEELVLRYRAIERKCREAAETAYAEEFRDFWKKD